MTTRHQRPIIIAGTTAVAAKMTTTIARTTAATAKMTRQRHHIIAEMTRTRQRHHVIDGTTATTTRQGCHHVIAGQ